MTTRMLSGWCRSGNPQAHDKCRRERGTDGRCECDCHTPRDAADVDVLREQSRALIRERDAARAQAAEYAAQIDRLVGSIGEAITRLEEGHAVGVVSVQLRRALREFASSPQAGAGVVRR